MIQAKSARWRLFAGICVGLLPAWTGLDAAELGVARTSAVKGGHSRGAASPGAASEALGFDLLEANPGNAVLSPHSVATALAMTGTGATGRTAAEIAEALHLGGAAAFDAVGKLQRQIARELAAVGEGHPRAPTLEMANGLFVQQGFTLKPAFLGGLRRNFGAPPEALDIVGNPAGALEAINSWVSDRTRGIVPELLDSLPSSTRLVLANAIYLKASWQHPFSPAMTAPAAFHGAAGSVSVDFMRRIAPLRYGAGRDYRAVELPYRASPLSLLIIMPKRKSVAALLRALGQRGLAPIVRGLTRTKVKLSLPRFRVSTKASLVETLKSLGMVTAFGGSAQFTRMAPGGG